MLPSTNEEGDDALWIPNIKRAGRIDMETFSIAPGKSWKMDTGKIHAISIKLHNESASADASYSAKLGALTELGTIPAGGGIEIGRWLAGGGELTVSNTANPANPATISGIVLGGARLTPGLSVQVPTKAGSSVKLTIFNDSDRYKAHTITWCGGRDCKPEKHEIDVGEPFTATMQCNGKPINVSNNTPRGEAANVTVITAPAD